MSNEWPILFEVETPLGFTVRTSPDYWEKISDYSGRAGSPLPAARLVTPDGAHGVTRPTQR